MDISKAFDSINTAMLERSLRHIKLPDKFIVLVMDIMLNCLNKVIVNKEFTEKYYVQDGVDQGEV